MDKKCLVVVAILSLVIAANILCGCEENKNENDNYYIKYDTQVTTIYTIKSGTVKVNTDSGVKKYDTIRISETFCPVSKNFLASLEAYLPQDYSHTTVSAEIHASKNNEPFVLKAYGSIDSPQETKPLRLDYKIDF